jgi:WD40 repeat protein
MNEAASSAGADWIRSGSGNSPALSWSFSTEGTLTGLSLARESGEAYLGDSTGAVYRLDRQGRIAAISRLNAAVRSLAWSDDGRYGVAVAGDSTVCFLNHVLQVQWTLELPEPALCAAIAPFGGQLLITCADSTNRIYDAAKKKLATFETMRPLSFAQFVGAETGIIGAAEHGLICRHQPNGTQVWSDKLWSTVGQLGVSGDGSLIYLACFTHGVQVYDGDGETVGSYMLDGTAARVAVSYEPQRMICATQERKLLWLDADGEILWWAAPPDDVALLQCDPLGEWVIVGLRCGRVLRLDWTRKG